MDLRFNGLKCPSCGDEMNSAGGEFGGKVTIVKFKCHSCGLGLLIVPMEKELGYKITATTEQERMEAAIKRDKESYKR